MGPLLSSFFLVWDLPLAEMNISLFGPAGLKGNLSLVSPSMGWDNPSHWLGARRSNPLVDK